MIFPCPPAESKLKEEVVNEQKSKPLRASLFSPSFPLSSRLSGRTAAASSAACSPAQKDGYLAIKS